MLDISINFIISLVLRQTGIIILISMRGRESHESLTLIANYWRDSNRFPLKYGVISH